MVSRIQSIIKTNCKLIPKLTSTSNKFIHTTNNLNFITTSTSLNSSDPISSTTATSTTTKTSNICPACSTPLPFQTVPTCPSCSTLLPPPSIHLSHFSLFNLSPNSFDINLKELKSKFRNYQTQVHPDLFVGQGGEKEDWAKIWSRRVNDAWKILEDERSRGEYLLEQNGILIGEGESFEDPELLMIVMETREALEEAKTESEVEEIRKINKDNMEETIRLLSNAFNNNNTTDLIQAKNLVIKLRYLLNVEQVCKDWSFGSKIQINH